MPSTFCCSRSSCASRHRRRLLRLEIGRQREARGELGRGRRGLLQHHRDRNVLHVERQREAEQQDQQHRHHDADRDAARIADQLLAFPCAPARRRRRNRAACGDLRRQHFRRSCALVAWRRPAVCAREPARRCAMKASSMVGPMRLARTPVAADARRRSLRQHAAAVEDRDAVAIFGLFHEMRGDDDGDLLLGERRDALPELAPRQRIGAARRLVEEQDLAARAAARPPSPGAACSRRAIARSRGASAAQARTGRAPRRCARACGAPRSP